MPGERGGHSTDFARSAPRLAGTRGEWRNPARNLIISFFRPGGVTHYSRTQGSVENGRRRGRRAPGARSGATSTKSIGPQAANGIRSGCRRLRCAYSTAAPRPAAVLYVEVQRRLPLLVINTLAECGMDLDGLGHEWTGDGINAVMPADMDPTIVLPALIRSLAANLSADNARSVDRIRLRMAIGVGLVEHSAAGFGGPMVIDTNRLVDSAPLRSALATYPSADLAVAISDQVHATVIRPGYPGIPGAQFSRVNVVAKEFSGPAWIWVSARQWSEPAYQPLAADDPREIGGYRVAARLGAGPTGRVYLASGQGDSWRAVKAFHPGLADDPDVRRRLVVGTRAASVPHGPHVARVIESDTEAGQPWVARTLIRGPSLAAAVAETGPLPAASAVWLALGVARAAAALHEAGLAHQGISPCNVLLEPDGRC